MLTTEQIQAEIQQARDRVEQLKLMDRRRETYGKIKQWSPKVPDSDSSVSVSFPTVTGGTFLVTVPTQEIATVVPIQILLEAYLEREILERSKDLGLE